ncbi:hypothetical protein BKA57DRAFT_488468 [Linnemannia elongata]|nr:hypothetical protein BKA57DRAFT_488468 [Linnemannia elongata]
MRVTSFESLPSEVQEMVGPFLSQQELTVCIRVCRAWKQMFNPYLWRDIVISLYDYDSWRFETVDALRANNHLIQSLRIKARFSEDRLNFFLGYGLPAFPRLNSIELKGPCEYDYDEDISRFLSLTSAPMGLKNIVFDKGRNYDGYFDFGFETFNALLSHASTLEVLRLNGKSFITCAPRLKELYLFGGNFYKQLGRLTKLRELSLGFPMDTTFAPSEKDFHRQYDCLAMTLESGLDLLKDLKDLRVVGLEDMEVYSDGDREQDWFAKNWPRARRNSTLSGALKTHGDNIRSIRLDCPYDKYQNPQSFWKHCPPDLPLLDSMTIIGQCTPHWKYLPLHCPPSVKWKKLVFDMSGYAGSNSYYGDDFFNLLDRHAPTLEVFRIDHRSYASGYGVNRLLSMAPNLRELYILSDRREMGGGMLDAREIARTGWVCTGLEVFVCRIGNIPRPDITRYIGGSLSREQVKSGTLEESIELQRQVYSKLARFTRLRELRLGFPVNSRTSYLKHRRGDKEKYRQYSCLAMTVESGLDLLKNLKELRIVGLQDMEIYIDGDKERTWFEENWPNATIGYEDYQTDSDATTVSRDSDSESYDSYTDIDSDDDINGDEDDEGENMNENEQ